MGSDICNSYHRVRKNSHGIMRGFKLNSRKFSVQRLRVKLLGVFSVLSRSWRSSYGTIIRLLKKKKNVYCTNKVKKQVDYGMHGGRNDYKLKCYSRTNSFYAEAIKDCLDFIKRNSVSLEEKPVLGDQSYLKD
ncbi:hypothetical protein R3W88_004583 [Solanum pinnatisectum]|uniref:Uncharacterized protein n=1 Tax=Solanum pinnatisectum TaxID=50273 RepID=A0AAV9KBN8_9SOLN|nr:hypothetical protein R3W88_004583 [Solanum pinnatisectum]